MAIVVSTQGSRWDGVGAGPRCRGGAKEASAQWPRMRFMEQVAVDGMCSRPRPSAGLWGPLGISISDRKAHLKWLEP